MLVRLALKRAPWLGNIPLNLTRSRILSRAPALANVNSAIFASFCILSLIILWPILGRDFPPGVDSPTFLHLAWITEEAVKGHQANPFSDPYWYGGFPYMESYPPLGYGLVGLVGAIPGFSFVVVYQIVLVVAVGSIGAITYWLGRELGLRWGLAALAAVLAVMAYPVLNAVFLWGWFSSVVAMPLALLAVLLLERSNRTSNWKLAVWGGVALGACTLVHHMTGIAFAMALAGWFVARTGLGVMSYRRSWRSFTVFAGVTALVVLPWGIPFLVHAIDVGFRREVPGNWMPPISIYRDNLLDRNLIGAYVYPSYLGSGPFIGLAVASTVYAMVSRHRMAGIAAALLVLTWFSMGAEANPLIRHYPFSGLDVARFPLYMVPLMGLLAGWLVDRAIGAAHRLQSTLRVEYWQRLWPAAVALLLAAILVMPVWDLIKTRDQMGSYQVDPDMSSALDWLAQKTHDPQQEAPRLYCVGCWNWDVFLMPYRSGVEVIDGWADEGAPNVDLVRPLRRTTWIFDTSMVVEGVEVHRMLTQLGASHVMLAPYYPVEDAEGFRSEFLAHPELFTLREQWGPLEMYEVLGVSPGL